MQKADPEVLLVEWQQLEEHFKGGDIKPIYLLCGDEDFLIERALMLLKERIMIPGAEAFDYQVVDGREITPEDIVLYANTLPALAPRRIVVIKNPPENVLNTGSGLLPAYIDKPAGTTCLVITVKGSVDKRLSVPRKINEKGCLVDFLQLKGQTLAASLRQEAKEQGYNLVPAAARLLAQWGGLRQARSELAKAMTYVGRPGPITLDHIYAIMSGNNNEGTVFQLVDAMGNRDSALAVSLLRQLLARGEEPLSILGMIARQLRLICHYHLLQNKNDLVSQLGVRPFVARKIISQARNFSLYSAGRALEELLKVDVGIKTGQGQAGSLLEKAVWTIVLKGDAECIP